jgi:tRNA-Thr(GGU) m(6)t(6)A37 methyltransferase TsaA
VSEALVVHPIGILRTPFVEKREAPRQPAAARGVAGRIELLRDQNFEHALEDLSTYSHLWIVFWFHENSGWKPKVLPPRSTRKRGVFATRSPHRPNPLGLSLVALERVDGLTLHIRDVDMLDGTPVLDIKPYVSYADSAPGARSGWLGSAEEASPDLDPKPRFQVSFSPLAALQADFLEDVFGVDLRAPLRQVLELGPEPHPYRRIRRTPRGSTLSYKEWRADFEAQGRDVRVLCIRTGYRPAQLTNESPELDVHRAFVLEFGE